MNWLEITALVIFFLGVGAAGFLVAQRPSFWFGMATVVFKAVLPFVNKYVTKRMSPEEEAAWRKCQLRGGKWNHLKKRCE